MELLDALDEGARQRMRAPQRQRAPQMARREAASRTHIASRRAPYSGSMPAALITVPHLCDSLAWNFASSSGVVVQASEPVLS